MKYNRFFSCILLTIMSLYTSIVSSQTLLIMGDSLSAAYNIPLESGWVELLKQRIKQQGYSTEVVNASISGETTGNAVKRLPALLEKHNPDIVLIELGGNDGLRGFELKSIKQNLENMIEDAKQVDAKVILTGIHIPPNYGPAYTQIFYNAYLNLAKKHDTLFIPFILEGVGDQPDLMQADGVHPTAAAQPKVLDNMWPQIEVAIQELNKTQK